MINTFCENVAVHARTAITFGATNTVIGGDVSIAPGTAITLMPPLIDGSLASRVDAELFNDSLDKSFLDALASRDDAHAFESEIGNTTFTPGTWYASTGNINIAASTTVILDGEGDPDAEFLFQASIAMWVGAGVNVVLKNGTKWENVLWVTGTMFTAGANADFYGSILSGEKIVFGADVNMHGCVVSKTAITFGANDLLTVAVPSPSPSNSPTASPTASPSHSPTSSPTVSPTTAAAISMAGCDGELYYPETIEFLENECPEDIQLVVINGATEYGDVPPIHILSQDQDTVTFQVHQNMFPGTVSLPGSVSYMSTAYYTAPNGDPTCSVNAAVTQHDNLIFTAGCMHMTPISIVDVWVVDAALNADYDTAKLFDWCPNKDTVLPSVQYTFKLQCVSLCVPSSAPSDSPSVSPSDSPSASPSVVELTILEKVLITFAVHAGTAITFAGSTVTCGDVGYGTAATGDSGVEDDEETYESTINSTALGIAITDVWAAGMAPRDNSTAIPDTPAAVIPVEGITFTPGNWNATTLTVIAGATIILDGQGDPDAEFHFQIENTMWMGAGCTITLINGATADNVLWAIGTTLTVGATARLQGSFVAGTAVTFGADTVVEGSVLAGTATFGAGTYIGGSVISGTAITFGAATQVDGSVVGLTAITFAAGNVIEGSCPTESSSASPSAAPSGATRRRMRGPPMKI